MSGHETAPFRIMVVDDNPVVRSGLISLLEAEGFQIVAEAGDGKRAVELADIVLPDLVLLDVRMPLVDGITAAEALSRRTRVLMLTYTDDPETIRAAVGKGAAGYLIHGTFDAEELAMAARSAIGGGNPLSPAAASALVRVVRDQAQETAPPPPRPVPDVPSLSRREAEVMDLITQGCSNGDIAARLCLSEKTIKNHVNHLYAKLGVTSRAAAIARWLGTDAGTQEVRRA